MSRRLYEWLVNEGVKISDFLHTYLNLAQATPDLRLFVEISRVSR
jgi:hypothetical protein